MHGRKQEKPLLTWAQARANRLRLDWDAYEPPTPAFLGRRVDRRAARRPGPVHRLDVLLRRVGAEGHASPASSSIRSTGRRRASCTTRRRRCSIASSPIDRSPPAASTASGRRRRWARTSCSTPAPIAGTSRRASRCCGSRRRSPTRKPNRSLADFVAPAESGVADHVGAFAVTAGLGVDDLVRAFEADHDDYQAIMVKALADRLAEAFAEYLHARARRDWGYGAAETLSNDQLIDEAYRGIRPAFGYPACPGPHREGDAVRAARRRGSRHGAHRVVRDDAAGQRQRHLPGAPGRAVLHGRPHRPGPGPGLRRAEGDGASRRSSAGWPRTSATSRPPTPPSSADALHDSGVVRRLRSPPQTPELFPDDSGVVS